MIRCLTYIEQAAKSMKIARILTVFFTLFLLLSFTGSAQKKKKPAPKPTPKPVSISPDVTNAKQQVSNQLFNVNYFVDKMGPIAIALETADKDAASGNLKKEAVDANNVNKQKIVTAIRGIRDGLVSLETDFRTKPLLAQYLPKLQGIGTLGAQSEDQAIAGQFVASKDPLRQAAQKLNDTLAVMPGGLVTGAAAATPSQSRNIPVSTTTSPNGTSAAATKPASSASSRSRKEPSIGMTADEALQSSWGAPTAKRTSTSSNGNTEVWLYSEGRSLYFFNGKLTNIVK